MRRLPAVPNAATQDYRRGTLTNRFSIRSLRHKSGAGTCVREQENLHPGRNSSWRFRISLVDARVRTDGAADRTLSVAQWLRMRLTGLCSPVLANGPLPVVRASGCRTSRACCRTVARGCSGVASTWLPIDNTSPVKLVIRRHHIPLRSLRSGSGLQINVTLASGPNHELGEGHYGGKPETGRPGLIALMYAGRPSLTSEPWRRSGG